MSLLRQKILSFEKTFKGNFLENHMEHIRNLKILSKMQSLPTTYPAVSNQRHLSAIFLAISSKGETCKKTDFNNKKIWRNDDDLFLTDDFN